MIIKVPELTNFQSNHGRKAEVAVMTAMCYHYDLEPGVVSKGYFSDYDFITEGVSFELKISSKSARNSYMELERADGRASGLSSTKADFHVFLNTAGNLGKLRIIPTYELQAFYRVNTAGTFTTQTNGDKIGSKLAPLDFFKLDDLMVLECYYNPFKKEFNTHTFRKNDYAEKMIHNFIKKDSV